jgi:HTH-like domain
VTAFIDEYRGRFGVEPICRILGVSASAYYQRATGQRSTRAVEDERLLGVIRALHAENYYARGSRRMWKALTRAGEHVGRGRVERLMRTHGIQGAKRRGKQWRTTRPDAHAQHRPDLVQRDRRGPRWAAHPPPPDRCRTTRSMPRWTSVSERMMREDHDVPGSEAPERSRLRRSIRWRCCPGRDRARREDRSARSRPRTPQRRAR